MITQFMPTSIRILRLILLGASVLLILSGCKDDDDDIIVQPEEIAYVSLYNASPDSPDLDVVVDDRPVNIYPLDYTEHTGYLRFYTGERNIQFRPNSAANVIIDTLFNLENNNAYSIFVVDSYNDAKAFFLNDNTSAPAEGNAKVRLINLSPDASEITLNNGETMDPMIQDVSFMEAMDFQEVDANNYDFKIGMNESDQTLNLSDINLQPGWYYTIIVRGYANPPAGSQSFLSAEVLVN